MGCNETGGSPPPGPPPPLPNLADASPPDIRYRLQVAQYVVVACLAVSLQFVRPTCVRFLTLLSYSCVSGIGSLRLLMSLRWFVVADGYLNTFCISFILLPGELSRVSAV
jgi:hypothetical protein